MAESATLYDAWGNPVKLADKPRKGFAHAIKAKDRIYQYSIRGLDPDTVWIAFTQAYNGNTSPLQAYFEQALRHDGRLYAYDQRRRGGVAGLDFVLRPYIERPCYGKDAGEPDPADVKLCDKVAEIFFAIPNLQDHVRSFMGAVGTGFQVMQLNWQEDGDVMRPFPRFIPPRKFTFQERSSETPIICQWPRILTDAELVYGEELDPNRYVVAIYLDASEVHRSGVLWPCLWWYLRKHEGWAQLMATGERFAEPALLGYISDHDMNGPLGSSTEDALEDYGPGTSVIIPGTGKPLGPDDRGAYISTDQVDLRIPKDFWTTAVEACDREMAIAWTGGNLLTDTTGGTGTHAAAKEQRGAEISDIRQFDADWLADGPMDRLIELITYFNFGAEAAAHRPRLTFPGLIPAEDLKHKADSYKILGDTNWDAVGNIPEAIREELELPELAQDEEPELEPPDTPEPAPGSEEPPEEVPEGQEEEDALEEPEATPEQRAESILEVRECSCSHIADSEHYEAQSAPGVRKLRDEIASILKRVEPFNIEAAERTRDRVTAHLLRLKRPPKNATTFRNTVLKYIRSNYKELSTELDAAGLGTWFADTYEHYKKTDRSIWPPARAETLTIKFGNKDRRAMAQIKRSSKWFFSKFTDNETYREPMTNFLGRVYAEEGAQLFSRNPKVVEAFGRTFEGKTRELANHEIDRIARTTVARSREQARIMQMHDAGVVQAVVRVHPDACPICAPYEGTVIDVQDQVTWIQNMSELEGEAWESAARDHTKQAIAGVPPHEFTDGSGGGPLYHPNCRCGLDMVFQE